MRLNSISEKRLHLDKSLEQISSLAYFFLTERFYSNPPQQGILCLPVIKRGEMSHIIQNF